MTTFKFELVSPERLLMSDEVEQVVVPGSEGDFTVLAGHAPVLSTLRPGVMDVKLPGGKAKRLYVKAGFAEVDPESLTVLAQQAIDVDEINPAWLAQAIKDAEEDLADAQTDAARLNANAALAHLRALEAAR
ncbi:MAG: F0F1 ATP synthase subunit epsilon [Hyphomicrobiaceae bacterium]|jgi:F-type H+-transporting ATPase subunit epsilon